MKEGWKMVKLTDISENLDYMRVPITKNVRELGKYPYYGASGIVDYVNDYIYDEDLLLISEDGANLLARTTPIAFSVSGKIWVNNHAHVLRFKSLTTQKFVEYFIAGFNIKAYVTGMAQPKLNQRALEKIKLPLPSLEEQHRIVSILDASFEKIDALKKNAEENLKNAKALFQQVLAQELKPKEGWVEKKLGGVCEISRGRSKHRPRNDKRLYGGNIPFIQTGDIRDACGGIITTYKQTYSELGLLQSRLWKKGTICITIAANIGETAILGFDACFPDSVVGIYPNDNTLNYLYVNYYLNSIKSYIDNQAYGAAQKNINLVIIENLKISFPANIEEQHRIVRTLDTLSEKCRRLEEVAQQTIRECDALKQSILRQAFSGEL